MALLITFATISIFFSFLCSVLEAVLLSITPTFINLKKQEGKGYAKNLEALKNDVDRPLIAILTLNTVAHTVGAILVGVQAEKTFGSGNNAVGIVSAIMTILILVVSEIIPKTIGATFWKQLAGFTSTGLNIIIFPLHYTGILWTLRLTTRLIGGGHAHESVFSREDFTAMTDIAEQEGVFDKSESKVIKNLLQFDEVLARDIMTPRTVMKTASEDLIIEDFFKKNPKLRFSRIPVYKDNPDHITGFILKDVVMEEIINGNGNMKLADIRRNILIVQRSLPIPKLFEDFIVQREHIALVVDEYGSVSGLVTMEDVIETLLGLEIVDESDNVEDLQVLARKNWKLRAKRLGILDEKNEES
ncbi:CNNM domain-containing protein [Sinomicrobium weinanense]|uniref:HlyC/CorC family transporter n=1 Tax=Sinomicrobium weinanense TaxID=2842200 RepID=A0A926JNU5_9FLAO|nr:hemolysin family protein [Sinomicrobium weinanense]MBC9794629.1 HlyC/CorC family transporter [Sinomicrobium weinanense]MBU3124114.1 hemolysin family protein [Sinomicrobium weinanense]